MSKAKSPRKVGEKTSFKSRPSSEGKKFVKKQNGERISAAKDRREKYAVSEVVKKLRLILTKLMLKKKDLTVEPGAAVQPKTELVAEGLAEHLEKLWFQAADREIAIIRGLVVVIKTAAI